jgi:predicted hotdog family 3-hydroxylacyl-ACP dehydratase
MTQTGSAVTIGKSALAGMIPHAGSMCLLDGVLRWDTHTISCIASSHRDPHNPLRRGAHLSAICGVEYASQAMAAHGRLGGAVGSRPRLGYLASLRELICREPYLDTLEGDLIVDAERLSGDALRVIYGFALHGGGREILRGRAAVLLDGGER